jgi:uncharacterized protein
MNRDGIISFLRDFKGKHADKYGIVSLCVFGSVARNELREDSDVDICVRTKTPDPFSLYHMKRDIEGILNRRVDIVRMRDNMNPFLKRRIEQEGIHV